MTIDTPIIEDVAPDHQAEAFAQWSVENQIEGATEHVREAAAAKLPHVILPSDGVTISNCAEDLFKLIGPSHQMFSRGGAVVTLVKRDDEMLALDILRPATARSFIEKYARLFAWRSGQKGEPVLKPVTCAHDMAEALLLSAEAAKYLPRVQGLINCPVLREIGGDLVAAGPGYDAVKYERPDGQCVLCDVPEALLHANPAGGSATCHFSPWPQQSRHRRASAKPNL